jgi:hypothetical protein
MSSIKQKRMTAQAARPQNLPKGPLIMDLQTPKPGRETRVVVFVEIADMDHQHFAQLAAEFSKAYRAQVPGEHYFIPVRNGRIGSDPLFEQEFEDVVNQLCEVKDGKIVLKDGAKRVNVIRHFVGE